MTLRRPLTYMFTGLEPLLGCGVLRVGAASPAFAYRRDRRDTVNQTTFWLRRRSA